MMMLRNILLGMSLLCSVAAFGQMKPYLKTAPRSEHKYQAKDIEPLHVWNVGAPLAKPNILQAGALSHNLGKFNKPALNGSLQVIKDAKTGLPIFIKGVIPNLQSAKPDWASQGMAYLQAVQEVMQIKNAEEEFKIVDIKTDALAQTHLRAQQYYQGVKVYDGDIWLHASGSQIQMLDGRFYATPTLANVTPKVTKERAIQTAFENVSKKTTVKTLSPAELRMIPGKQAEAELVVYHLPDNTKDEYLAWAITLYPNVLKRWMYFVDAKTGQVLHQYSDFCTIIPDLKKTTMNKLLLPPRTATAKDLFNTNISINTWQEGSTYYLIDASRSMFNSGASSFPDSPVGVIWTIDGTGTSPENNDFNTIQVTSGNNAWSKPAAISAHNNAGKAYAYYEQTFNRNSINGQGGNIISIVNIIDSDGSQLDNAFWNGQFMFYGNGNQAFTAPLSKALDVGGHELTHGVIQNTANLDYQGESGAMNEAYADIYGAMIERKNWQIGEDVTNSQYFPTGALRDMSNPHNGGSSLNDNGWQPAHVSEQYHGSQDNGGVHINSGIVNKAYYLFATAIGKDKAEQVFYRALTTYLVRSSKFIDLRIAILQSATDLYGANSAEVTAAGSAFDAVGIVGTQGGNYQGDVNSNNGDEYIVYSNGNQTNLNIVTPNGDQVAVPLTNVGSLSKPSVTDDGSVILYVANDQTMRAVVLDWNQGSYSQQTVSSQKIWRNAVISKDGTKIAALTDDYDNTVYIFDLLGNTNQAYELYNPTFTQGVSTGDVEYADAMEWDFSGEYLMYDVLSSIKTGTDSIEYWDIGFLRAWDNTGDTFGDGNIQKLFSGLPENVSVGNPTFSKNSPYIISFDYVDFYNNDYAILGANIETGDVGTIYQNSDLSFPNYSIDDKYNIFDGFVGFSGDPVVGIVELASDKINASTDPPSAQALIQGDNSGARWGVWFANGARVLTDNQEVSLFDQSLQIFPNPFKEIIYLRGELNQSAPLQIEVFDQFGQRLQAQRADAAVGQWQQSLSLRNLPAGTYVIRVSAGANSATRKVVKLK